MPSVITRSSTRSRRGFIFPPIRTDQVWKITVTDTSGTELDITGLISKCKIEDFATESIGSFEFEIEDPNEVYANLWTGYEVFKYYMDYGTIATTIKFRGRIERLSKRYHRLVVNGRRESVLFFDRKVTYLSSTPQATSTILNTLISTYAPTFTNTSVATSTTTLSVNWVEKPFWECVKELCSASGFECYDDAYLNFHYFESGSNENFEDAISHDYNLLDIGDFTPDLTQVKNKVKVYGATLDDLRIFYTSVDTSANIIANFGTLTYKEEIIEDENITTYEQAVEVANYELSVKKNPPITGSVKAFLLPTVRPGDSVYISDVSNKLTPGFYVCNGYAEVIDYVEGEYYTEVHLNKEPRKISHVIRDRIIIENKATKNASNPNGLGYSYLFTFDQDEGTHSSTAILNGILYPTSSTGTWISPTRVLSSNVDQVYLSLKAEDINNITISVSSDSGLTYQNISNGELLTIGSGDGLVVRVVFNSATAAIQGLSLMYSLT